MKPSIDELVDSLLPTTQTEDTPKNDYTDSSRVYPELLLYKLAHANKLYHSFQKYTRQFMADAPQINIVHFADSDLGLQLAQKVHAWDLVDSTSNNQETSPLRWSFGGSRQANALFAWSSGDKYISARKLELQNKSAKAGLLERQASSTPPPSPSAATRLRPSMTHRINTLVENESNKFIQERIQIIKAHHIEQVSRKIDERKKRDHELYFRRVKNKESQYEKAIKEAIASKGLERRSLGLFGSLFGLNHKSISSSFILDLGEADRVVPETKNSRQSLAESDRSKTSRPSTPTPKTFLKSSLKLPFESKEESLTLSQGYKADSESESILNPCLPSACPSTTPLNIVGLDLLQL